MTNDEIKNLLLSDVGAVERAIVALYRQQTPDEQRSRSTQHTNGKGFNAFEASDGSYCATWVLSGRRLSGRFVDKARRIVMGHVPQLAMLGVFAPKPKPAPRRVWPVRVETHHVSDIGSAMAIWDPFC